MPSVAHCCCSRRASRRAKPIPSTPWLLKRKTARQRLHIWRRGSHARHPPAPAIRAVGRPYRRPLLPGDPPNPHFATADLDTALKYIDNGGRVKVDLTGLTSRSRTVELAFSTTGNPSRLTYRTLVAGTSRSAGLRSENRVAAQPTSVAGHGQAYRRKARPGQAACRQANPRRNVAGWFQTLETWILGHGWREILAGVGLVICLLAFITYRMDPRPRSGPGHASFCRRVFAGSPSRKETSRMRPGVAPTVAVDERSQSSPLATLQPVMAAARRMSSETRW